MKRQVDRRSFLKIAGMSLGVGVVYPSIPSLVPHRATGIIGNPFESTTGEALAQPVHPCQTVTLRNDAERTGTNPVFPIHPSLPWYKYVSIDLGTTAIGGVTVDRTVRAGVLVIQNWQFNAGPLNGQTRTLALVATTTNELYCYDERSLLAVGAASTPLWYRSLGVAPSMRGGSNLTPPIGICGTPVVDAASRRIFVVALWEDASGAGHYTIFNIALDTGAIIASEELVDAGAVGRPTFTAEMLDQRTAINMTSGWLWFGFAAFLAGDAGRQCGWVVAVRPDDLTQQLYQPMISLNSMNTWGIYGGGVWGSAGLAAGGDGSVYVLTGNAVQFDPSDTSGTNPAFDLTSFGSDYWGNVPTAGPGSIGDYFNAVVRLGISPVGTLPQIQVLDWFQGSTITRPENAGDWDFGGSSPLVLPPINGQQLLAFVPKDGDIFVLSTQNLGNFAEPLTRVTFANAFNANPQGGDTKVALSFLQKAGINILIVGADSNGPLGGFAAFQIDTTTVPPTLAQLWHQPYRLRDSFGSPLVISRPDSPLSHAWVIDGDDSESGFLQNCAMRAYDILTGAVVYDSTAANQVGELIPHFAPLTSGDFSVFCPTSKGFVGFTQRPGSGNQVGTGAIRRSLRGKS